MAREKPYFATLSEIIFFWYLFLKITLLSLPSCPKTLYSCYIKLQKS